MKLSKWVIEGFVTAKVEEVKSRESKKTLYFRARFFFEGNVGNGPNIRFTDFRCFPEQKNLAIAILEHAIDWATPEEQAIIIKSVKKRFLRGKISSEVLEIISADWLIIEGCPKFKTFEQLEEDLAKVQRFLWMKSKKTE